MKKKIITALILMGTFCMYLNIGVSQTLTSIPANFSYGSRNAINIDTTILALQISGSSLSPASDSITVSAPSACLVSKTWNGVYSSSVKFGYTGSALSTTTLYVKIIPSSASAYNQAVTVSGGGAAEKKVDLTGNVELKWSMPSASGTWNTVQWKSTADGGATWSNASIPGGSENIFIPSGITLNIDSTLNLTLTGYVKVRGVLGIAGNTQKGTLTFNGNTYEHGYNAGSIPLATWGAGSTCLVTGTTSTNPSGTPAGQVFHNFIWNCPAQTTNLNLGWDLVTLNGDLTCSASGPNAANQFRLTSAATVRKIDILGNVIVNGGYLTSSGSSGAAFYNINVSKDLNIQSGRFNLVAGSGGKATWNLQGNVTISSGATFASSSNSTDSTKLVFMSGSTQYFTNNGTCSNLNYGVENGTVVVLNSPLNAGGTSASSPGYLDLTDGTFVTTSTNILTMSNYCILNGNSVAGKGYINGPLSITISSKTATKTFPVGKGFASRPVVLNLTQSAATATVYTAEVFNSAPTVRTLPTGIDSVSKVRYVRITKGTGAEVISPTSVQLSYGTDDKVTDSSVVRVAMDDGAGNWLNIGGSGKGTTNGTILSDAFSGLSANDFVLAHKDPNVPTVLATLNTTEAKNISTLTAVSGGTITNSGNDAITARGVCWNTSSGPTIANNKTNDGAGTGTFTSSVTGLTAGTKYYIRAYATNSAGTAYGSEITFTTLTVLSAPTVKTDSVGNVVNKDVVGYGTVLSWGGAAITSQGICWSTSHNPTTADTTLFSASTVTGEGPFTAQIGGLTLGTTYYARAYAANSVGTSYGSEVSFKTANPQPDVYKMVAKDGSGDYKTIQAAFDAVPSSYTGHWIIKVKKGTYYEKILLSAGKINVVLIGEDKDSTILTYDDYAGKSSTSNGTSTSYSVAIDAADFQAQNITFRNTATTAQAVALRTNGDRQVYYNCKMVGYQDTYYTWGGSSADRIYNKNCYIEGSVDFIFGRDVAVFDSCTLYCNRNGGVLTAAATEPGFKFGYVFLNSAIQSLPAGTIGFDGNPMSSFYLGRPWQQAPQTVFINCTEPATLNAAGWTTMGPNPALYAEYNCSGPGYLATRSVIWSATSQPSKISAAQASTYTIGNIFAKTTAAAPYSFSSNWVPQILNIPFKQTDVKEKNREIPSTYFLNNNYPNPFNPTTNVEYSIPFMSKVTLKIFTLLGQEVITLVDGIQNPGYYNATWDGKGKDGLRTASGMYLLRIVAEPADGGAAFMQTKKLLLSK